MKIKFESLKGFNEIEFSTKLITELMPLLLGLTHDLICAYLLEHLFADILFGILVINLKKANVIVLQSFSNGSFRRNKNNLFI